MQRILERTFVSVKPPVAQAPDTPGAHGVDEVDPSSAGAPGVSPGLDVRGWSHRNLTLTGRR